MISKEEVRSKLMKASIRGRAKAPEVHFHLEEAYTCLENELYIASCLCSITFIDISMRYLYAALENVEGDNSGQWKTIDLTVKPKISDNTYMDRGMLKRLRDRGVDISPLALEGLPDLNKILDIDKGKPKIRCLRDDLCHGNVANYFERTPEGEVFHPELMKQQAHELYSAANAWLNEFQKCKEALGY
ncbi:hypothetical protein [Vreelandella venusta]|uniref:HEPN domain-containing protein n=1 Tax=Vreelandella venusta TaxID=44935 RepID=A0ABX2BCP6_9GAMM|nr:hypothetical protein [Halomonas venusta]AZM96055.1 hypothetical protein EI420_10335 [Halomonas venusta]NPT30656.1 hypothetical protein [Halomonas venusta]